MRSFYMINKKNDYNERINNVEIVERTEIEVAEIILNQFSCEGDYIIDPFMGLGTIVSIANDLKRKCWGIEIDKSRYDYVCNVSKNTKGITLINEDALNVDFKKLPKFDLCFTSPPFTWEWNAENPLREKYQNYSDNLYNDYLDNLLKIFTNIKQNMKTDSFIVIDSGNVCFSGKNTTLAWDIKKKLNTLFKFQYEIVFCWEDKKINNKDKYFYYQHSYCLVFKNY